MKKYEAMAGEHISKTARKIVAMAQNCGGDVTAEFNDIELRATPTSAEDEILSAYHAECERRAEEYRKSPEGIAAAARQQESQRIAAEAVAEGILPFSLKDQAAWDKSVAVNTDGYGACVTRFAARFANYMERDMAEGLPLNEAIEKASHEADKEGITGFMYGCAISILSQVWTHGEQLRQIHNRKTQIGTEGDKANESGGVLNPALLTLG